MKNLLILLGITILSPGLQAQERMVSDLPESPRFIGIDLDEDLSGALRSVAANGIDYKETFETETNLWTTQKIDNGTVHSSVGISNPNGWVRLYSAETLFAGSVSKFTNSSIQADRWLFTKAVTLTSNDAWLSWKERSFNASARDNYEVYITTTIAGTQPAKTDFTQGAIYSSNGAGAEPQWTERNVNLAALGYTSGQTVYIAFRHYDKNKYILGIDDIWVTSAATPADLSIGKVTTSYTQLPLRHSAGKFTFGAFVKRNFAPMEEPAYLSVTVKDNDDYVGNAEISAFLEGVPQFYTASPGFSPLTTGVHTATFQVSSYNDPDITDNKATASFTVTANTFATDNGSFLSAGIGSTKPGIVGNLYELKTADRVNSVSLAFSEISSVDFTVSIYTVDLGTMTVVPVYTSQKFTRGGSKNTFAEYVFDMPQYLTAGYYLFTVDQLNSTNIRIATDGQTGKAYEVLSDFSLYTYESLGNLAIRVNLAPIAPDLVITGILMEKYSQIPYKQAKALGVNTSIKNIGAPWADPATLNVSIINKSNQPVYTENITIPTTLGATPQTFIPELTLTAGSVVDSCRLSLNVWVAGDADPSNNIYTSDYFSVTEQTFARDYGKGYSGLSTNTHALAYPFELKQADRIKSFSVAFSGLTSGEEPQFRFFIYKWKNDQSAESATPLYTSPVFENRDNFVEYGFREYAIEPQELPAGIYLFAIRSVSGKLRIAVDSKTGFFYMLDPANGQLEYTDGFHNLMLRVNTDPESSAIQKHSAISNSTVYPTITNGNIVVNTNGAATIKIAGLSGKVLKTCVSTGEQIINLDFENGIYFVTVGNEQGFVTHKVILRK